MITREKIEDAILMILGRAQEDVAVEILDEARIGSFRNTGRIRIDFRDGSVWAIEVKNICEAHQDKS